MGESPVIYRDLKKQYTSKYCFVCGEENASGLAARFYELENHEIVAVFTGRPDHCSYPDRMHGGVISAMLDETIGRAILIDEPDVFGVTVDLSVQFKKPVPLETELRIVARITKNRSRLFEGTGELLLPDGTVAATGYGKYMKLSFDDITKNETGEELKFTTKPDDKTEIEL